MSTVFLWGKAATDRLALWLALAGGFVLVAIMLTSVASIVGRNLPVLLSLLGFRLEPWSVPGDVELAQLGTAVAACAFLPYANVRDANVRVDVVTRRLPALGRYVLDLIASQLFFVVVSLMFRQVGLGFFDKIDNGEESMALRIPLWAAHGFFFLSFGVLLLTATFKFPSILREVD